VTKAVNQSMLRIFTCLEYSLILASIVPRPLAPGIICMHIYLEHIKTVNKYHEGKKCVFSLYRVVISLTVRKLKQSVIVCMWPKQHVADTYKCISHLCITTLCHKHHNSVSITTQHFITNITSLYHKHHISISQTSHQFITIITSVYHNHQNIVSQTSQQCITNITLVYHKQNNT
jgi:hypothetical protein